MAVGNNLLFHIRHRVHHRNEKSNFQRNRQRPKKRAKTKINRKLINSILLVFLFLFFYSFEFGMSRLLLNYLSENNVIAFQVCRRFVHFHRRRRRHCHQSSNRIIINRMNSSRALQRVHRHN